MKKGFRRLSFVLCFTLVFIFLFLTLALPENITITTYYPAPFGVYKELRAERMAIGDSYHAPSQYCWPGGSCSFPNIDADADLIVEGNVGIGTMSPSEKLVVDGSILLSSDSGALKLRNNKGYISGENTAGEYGIMLFPGGDNNIVLGDYNSKFNGIRIYTNGADAVMIDNNGNVGIGTTSPTQKLDVSGQIHATEDICTDAGGGVCLSSAGVLELTNCAWTSYGFCSAGGSGDLLCPAGKVAAGVSSVGCTSGTCDDITRCERNRIYCCDISL